MSDKPEPPKDWPEGFVLYTKWITLEEFKRLYPPPEPKGDER